MKLPEGFNSDPGEWLETSFGFDAVLECYPLMMRVMLIECLVDQEDVMEVLPPDAALLETAGLNIMSSPDHPMMVTDCPNHPRRQEYFLAYLNAMQLMSRIDAKHPAATADSPQLAMLILYTGIQEAKEEKRKYDEWERNQEGDQ